MKGHPISAYLASEGPGMTQHAQKPEWMTIFGLCLLTFFVEICEEV